MLARRFSTTLDSWLKNLAATGRGRKQALSMAVDATLCVIALWLAYSLRTGRIFTDFGNTYHLFLMLPAITLLTFGGLGVYRWVVRSTNRRLFKQLAKGSLFSALTLVLILFLLPPDRLNPRSLMAIYGMLLFFGTAGLRFVWQGMFDAGNRGQPIAIYGAGAAGRQLVSLLTMGSEYRPVVLIDDNPKLRTSTVAGLPVLDGNGTELKERLHQYEATRIILAMPSLGPARYREKVDKLKGIDLPIQTTPGIRELVSGVAQADQIRDISITDILGRQEVPPDRELLGRCVQGKSVLVTGGGGSIGSELCRQIIAQRPQHLVVLDNCEANLYHITEELRSRKQNDELLASVDFTPVLCSVTDKARVRALVENHKIDTIYHAAAYKHVPIIERHPEQGVDVNVFGTLNVLDAAIDAKVGNFVLISTDKAVRPTNAMGATKRVAELILQAKARTHTHTRISMVRFGNVLGSSGSVVPKFRKQIEAGGPITLTHPEITRFFMTIPEASQLVMQASAVAKGGEVFVLDMGEPVRIIDMAKTLVQLYGKRLKSETGRDGDIEICVEGLRPGEKMFEELFLTSDHSDTKVPKVMSANEAWERWPQLSVRLEELAALCNDENRIALRETLLATAALKGAEVMTTPAVVPEVAVVRSVQVRDSRGSLDDTAAMANA